jgi:hypothetical protein
VPPAHDAHLDGENHLTPDPPVPDRFDARFELPTTASTEEHRTFARALGMVKDDAADWPTPIEGVAYSIAITIPGMTSADAAVQLDTFQRLGLPSMTLELLDLGTADDDRFDEDTMAEWGEDPDADGD